MKPNNKKIVAFLAGFLYMAAGLSPVWADDTEIYFGNVSGGGAKANLLFILDTSKSMDTVDPGSSVSRLQQLKDAMNLLLKDLTNVNVGIMRFSNPGGPVLYPVSNLDSIATPSGVVNTRVITATDDGYEQVSGTGGMIMGRSGLELGAQAPSGTTIAAVKTTITLASSGNSNDASSDLLPAKLYLKDDPIIYAPYSPTAVARVNGFRFTGVAVPKNAHITRAYLELQVAETSTAVDNLPLQLDILGEPADLLVFTATTARTPATRVNATNLLPQAGGLPSPVIWTMNTLPAGEDVVRSADIAQIIQGMVTNSAWVTNNGSATLLFRKTATSLSNKWVGFSSIDRKDAIAPKLVIEYYPDSQTPTLSATTTAVRFPSVSVPKGATIKGAFLTFAAQQSDTSNAAISVKAEMSGNSAEITSSAKIIGRTATSNAVTWSTAAGNLTSWVANESYSTPDLQAVVQEVVSKDDWCGGNAMTFLLSGTLGQRVASALEDGDALAPQLSIQYDPVLPGSTCVNAQTIAQVNAGDDDAEEYNSAMVLADSDLEMGTVTRGSNNKDYKQKVGFMFRNIQIPQGQIVTSAYIQFVSKYDDGSSSSSPSLTIAGEDTATPEDYTLTKKLTGRATTGSVSWTPPQWKESGTYTTPDIKSLIQPAINKPDWASGKNLSLIVTTNTAETGKYRRPYSFATPSKAAKLIINYSNTKTSDIPVKNLLKETINDLVANGNTPIQDTMYEAALYFSGSNVVYGSQRGGPFSFISATAGESGPLAATRVSHPKSYRGGLLVRPLGCTDANLNDPKCAGEKIAPVSLPGPNGQYTSGAKYISPVTVSCQLNHIVLLTDGIANDAHSTALAKTLTGVSSCIPTPNNSHTACVADMAMWLKDGDMAPTVAGKQGVITDTIAFHMNGTSTETINAVSFLRDLAIKGGSPKQDVYSVASATDLSAALGEIVGQVRSSNTSFVSAGTAVNAFNRAVNRDELYFSVFQPASTPRWPGNMKKYKSGMIGDVPAILDKNKANAVDANGFFAANSTDFWNASGTPDGPEVVKGGAASLITNHATRKVYTYLDDIATPSKDLTNAANNFAADNTNLTLARMGGSLPTTLPGPWTLENLIDWTRGKDVQNKDAPTGTRFLFADPLHSRPVAVTYGGSEDDADISVFVSTNSGFLHAIDNKTGAEQFAFIPKELLPLQKILFDNFTSTSHPYGLDGSVTVWVKDPEADGVVLDKSNVLQPNNGVYLYVGMRRGGRNYYALDVSDRANPKILWTIKGGVDSGFNNLGQTWSQPIKSRIKLGTTVRDVLIFSGGYASNNNQDVSKLRDGLATDTDGNAIYIVDAMSGALLWRGSNASGSDLVLADMKYSIPSNIAGADINGDGLMDVLFVGDMGGQLWRFDVKNGASTAGTLVTGGVIADLNAAGGTATAANNRRFYQAPALFLGEAGGKPYLGVAIGSGYRAHPLNNTTEDQFYMIKQADVFTAPGSYTKLTEADLYDATDNLIGEGTDTQKTAALVDLDAADGWFISMDNQGEKVLSTPLVVEGQLFFNTYQPGAPPNVDPCAPATGINRSYTMSAFDATPTSDINGVVGLQRSDRSQILLSAGIIDQQRQIVKVVNDEARNFGIEGQNIKNLPSDFLKKVHRVYWYENR